MSLSGKIRKNLKDNNQIALPFLHFFHSTNKYIPMPQSKTPYIYFVLDGELRLYTPAGVLDYVNGQYLVSAIDTPEKGYVLVFSSQKDFLAASVDFLANDVLSVIIELDDSLCNQIFDDKLSEEFKSGQDKCVISCLERMVNALDEPLSMSFLCEQIRKEMIFHILCGSCGKAFIQSITNMRSISEIYVANSWIKQNYRKNFKIDELAEQWNMSVSQFHQKFKSAVGMGPLQCQKRLRLTEARRLMLDEGRNVTEAAFEVGYESLSQFTREYRKMFGSSPTEDIQFLSKEQKK